MDSMASAIGLSVPVLRFLLCFAATIPVSFFHRFVPGGPPARHFYAAATGAFLSYLSFGFSSNLHFVVPMLLGYASMLLCRKYCGILTFFLAFGYLIGWSVLLFFLVYRNLLFQALYLSSKFSSFFSPSARQNLIVFGVIFSFHPLLLVGILSEVYCLLKRGTRLKILYKLRGLSCDYI